jgi:hypothetical protein
MLKVIIYPTNSLILSDLVERFGHNPCNDGKDKRESKYSRSRFHHPLI